MGDPVITPAFKFSKTDTSSILGGREGIIIVYERTFYHKWSPHKAYEFREFHFEGVSNSICSVEGLVQIQESRNGKQNS